MTQFSIGGAWSKGIGFFSNEAAGHAAILIGLGLVVPTILQFLLVGGPAGMANQAMGQNFFASMAYAGTVGLVVTLATHVLQVGSYFASWRLGFGRDGNVAGAILYGLIAAAGVVAIFLGLLFVGGMIIGGALGGGSPVGTIVLVLLLLVPLAVLFAALYTVLMALMCVAMALLLLLVIALGSMAGTPNPALGMMGGGSAGLLIALALLLLLLWLTARLSCTGAAMADRGSFNLFGAMARSWRLTGEAQWRIMAYLALLGILLCVVVFIFALFVGASMMSGLRAGGLPALGTGGMIVTLLVSIPFVYLVVLVPAGLYRELYEDSPAAVFT